jgi:hypothetical protein
MEDIVSMGLVLIINVTIENEMDQKRKFPHVEERGELGSSNLQQ